MGNAKHNPTKSEVVVRTEAGDLEVVDLLTGEVIATSTKQELMESKLVFNYNLALEICQEVKNGKTLLQIGNDPKYPPLHIISHWMRTERMFAEEMRLARSERAEVYHDKVLEIADRMLMGDITGRDNVAAATAAANQYKWAAEKGNPDRYGNKVTHEGSTEKPILMRVVNTGINRTKPDVVVPTKEIINVSEEGTQRRKETGTIRENEDG